MSISRTTIYSVIAFLLTLVIPTVASLWPFWRQTDKSLEYSVVSVSPLGPSRALGFGDLKLLKGNDVIEQPYLATVKIVNSGSVPIQVGDFAGPIYIRTAAASVLKGVASVQLTEKQFEEVGLGRYMWLRDFKGFNPSVKPAIVDARLARASPSNLAAKLGVTKDWVHIEPLLLNAGDEFEVELLLSGGVPIIEADSRIAGIKNLNRQTIEPSKISKGRVALALVAIFLLVLMSWVFWFYGVWQRSTDTRPWFLGRASAAVFFVACMIPIAVMFDDVAVFFDSRQVAAVVVLGLAVIATLVTMFLDLPKMHHDQG